jgi:hypothetical protein
MVQSCPQLRFFILMVRLYHQSPVFTHIREIGISVIGFFLIRTLHGDFV